MSIAHNLTGINLPKPQEIASYLHISGMDVRTPHASVKEPTPTGFIGWVRLSLHTSSKDKRKLIYGMLKLCEKVNIGDNRASGYGEIVIKTGSK